MNSRRKIGLLSKSWAKCLTALVLTLVLFVPFAPAQKKQKLAKNYKEWLDQEVVYIITPDERQRFLKLTSDEARDKFIDEFWAVRNPDPGSEINTYKEEYYQRVAFANARFGVGSGTDGWRTDRGHVYIVLGPPQSKMTYRNAANLRPLEYWFYANVNPALPQAFYVLFYDRDSTGDYVTYSPYNDGPDKLTTGVEAINDPLAGLSMIQNSVGSEVAKMSLSLIIGEPVDTSNPRPSLASDVMISEIKGLANLPSYRDDIRRKWLYREQVTSSMILAGHNLDVILLPVRDERGLSRLDYSVGLKNPSDLSVTTTKDDRLSYSVQIRAQVFDRDNNKLLFTVQKDLHDTFDKDHFRDIKDRAFTFESMLPLPPGNYRFAFQFTDWNKNVSYRTEREVSIPNVTPKQFLVPALLPFASAEQVDPVAAPVLPFTLAGVRFVPLSTSNLVVSNHHDLEIAYQVWTAANNPELHKDEKLRVEYGLGQPSVPGSAKSILDDASLNQFDSGGSLVSGKKLSLAGGFGNFMLTVAITGPEPGTPSFAKLNFKAGDPSALPSPPWIITDTTIRDDMEKGVFDRERGLCYLNQGLATEGRGWLRRALGFNHSDEISRSELVGAYFAKQDYNAVAALYKDTGVTDTADPTTLLRIATSLSKLGNQSEAVRLMEHGANVRAEDPSMFLALGEFYNQIGNAAKASAALQRSKQLTSSN